MTARRYDDGTASLEMVILAPFLLLMLMLIIAFGRYAQTEDLVDQASRDAARAATAQNDKAKVGEIVSQTMKEDMADAPSSCRDTASPQVRMTSEAFQLFDPNQPNQSVTVTVTCTVDMSDLAGLPLKDVVISQTFTSPLDRYRGYQ